MNFVEVFSVIFKDRIGRDIVVQDIYYVDMCEEII